MSRNKLIEYYEKPLKVELASYSKNAAPDLSQVGVRRVVTMHSRLEGRFNYGLNNAFWLEAANTNSTKTYIPEQLGIKLTTGLNAGDKYYTIGSLIHYYQPDTVIHFAGALLLDTSPGAIKGWGAVSWQDNAIKDGFILRNNNGTIQLVVYTSASGTTETIVINQDEFTPYVSKLNWEYLQMLEVEYAWYGGGSVILKARIEGYIYELCKYSPTNKKKLPITGNPNLSVCYFVENITAVSTPTELSHWGLSVTTDGQKQETGTLRGFLTTPTSVTGGVWTPVLAFRLKQNFAIDGATPKLNVYGYVTKMMATIKSSGRDAQIAIVKDAVLTGGTWGDIVDVAGNPDTSSMVEVNTTATMTGGSIVMPRTLPSGAYTETNVLDQEILGLNSLGVVPLPIVIAARPAAGGNATIDASLSWKEVY